MWTPATTKLPDKHIKIDLWLQRHDIDGYQSLRIIDCYYDPSVGKFVTGQHREVIVSRKYNHLNITHWMPSPSRPEENV